jgi:hypothetical protein
VLVSQLNRKKMFNRTAKYYARVRDRVVAEQFNHVMDWNIPVLADELTNINADAALYASGVIIK